MSLARCVCLVGGRRRRCLLSDRAGWPADGAEVDGRARRARELPPAGSRRSESRQSRSTDPLAVDPDLAIWTLLVFVVLLAVLWKFAWGPIVAGLEKREQAIADNIAAAKRQHEEAKRLVAEYEAQAGRRRRRSAGDHGRSPPRRRACQASDSGRGQEGAEAETERALHEIETATDASLAIAGRAERPLGGRTGRQDRPAAS